MIARWIAALRMFFLRRHIDAINARHAARTARCVARIYREE